MTRGLLAIAPALWLACGGGSGSDPVQVSPPRLDIAGVPATIGTPEVQVTVSPDVGAPVYVHAYMEGAGFDEPFLIFEGLTARVLFNILPSTAPGTYTGTLVILVCADEDCRRPVGSSPYRIPYRLDLHEALVHPDDVSIRVGSTMTLDDSRRSVALRMNGPSVHSWTAESRHPGIALDTPSGLTGDELRFHLDASGLSPLLNGSTDTGYIDLHFDDPELDDSVKIDIDLELAEIRQVTPVGMPAGLPNSLLITGTGFTSEPELLARVTVNGVPGASASYVSATQLRLQVPAAAPGGYRVEVPNALGIPTRTATLRLASPVSLPYATIAARQVTQSVIWDDLHEALVVLASGDVYASYPGDQGWMTSNLPLQPDEIALTADGAYIFAANVGGVGRLDLAHPSQSYILPLTLAGDTSPTTQLGVNPNHLSAITADGRAWLQPHGLLGYTSENGPAAYTVDPSGLLSPNVTVAGTVAPRDGSRLYVATISDPFAPRSFVYMDVADGIWRRLPAGVGYPETLSYDGDRFFSGNEVFDGAFRRVGTVPNTCFLVACPEIRARVFAPDGTRLYVVQGTIGWFSSGPSPKVVAFDTRQPVTGDLPILGYFDLLPDGRSCDMGEETCLMTDAVAMTSDGGTLFVGSDDGVHVVPVPGTLLPWPPP